MKAVPFGFKSMLNCLNLDKSAYFQLWGVYLLFIIYINFERGNPFSTYILAPVLAAILAAISIFSLCVIYLLIIYCVAACIYVIYPILPAYIRMRWHPFRQTEANQAHLLFVTSVALLGWALWLQNGGNWQQMAVLNSPITIPGFFTIPFTASISFPTALLGWVENPVQSALSTVAHAPFDLTIALFFVAAVLFFFAINRLKLSAVGVRPELAWLAFALFCAAGYVDVALHWRGAPVLHPALILFNRTFAVLALGVYLFWRFTARQAPEAVEGESGEYQAAFDVADSSARKAALWLLGLLWLATQFSHGFPNGFPDWIVTVMLALLVWFPVQTLINFSGEYQAALGRYKKLLALQRQAYKPPSTVASDEQVRDALNGGRGIGQRGPDGKPWNDPGD